MTIKDISIQVKNSFSLTDAEELINKYTDSKLNKIIKMIDETKSTEIGGINKIRNFSIDIAIEIIKKELTTKKK